MASLILAGATLTFCQRIAILMLMHLTNYAVQCLVRPPLPQHQPAPQLIYSLTEVVAGEVGAAVAVGIVMVLAKTL